VQISKSHNYAYVNELKNHYPALIDWANNFGFTVEELAWIQPGYPPISQNWNRVGNNEGVQGKVNVMKAYGDKFLYMAGNFSAVDGVEANNIISWDGNNWQALGDGINGEIHDIAIDEDGRVFVGGSFIVNNSSIRNVAYWDDGVWKGFNTSNMDGSINAVHIANDKLYIGGAFDLEYSGQHIQNLAFAKLSDETFSNQNGDFSVDDEVFDITSAGERIYIAGSFVNTATQASNNMISKLSTKYLAVWGHDSVLGYSNWLQSFDHEMEPSLSTVFVNNNKLYVGANNDEAYDFKGIGIFENDSWEYNYCGKINHDQFNLVNGFLNHNDIILSYGNISYVGMYSMVQLYGLAVLENNINEANGAQFDDRVYAAESFQGEIYFAGPFTKVQGQAFPGLVSSPFSGYTFTEEIDDQKPFKIIASQDQINIAYENMATDFDLNIYSLDGKFMFQERLPRGTSYIEIMTKDWPSGIYVYQAVSKSGKIYSDKLSLVK